jgi:hypothetical protein
MKNIKFFSYAVTIMCLLAFGSSAKATPITVLDTGPGPNSSTGYTLSANQWLAVRFTMPEAYIITDIFGWIYSNSGSGLTLAIYGHADSVPDQSNEIFSILTDPADNTLNWFGASGLSFLLDPGNYWVAFEVRPGGTFRGTMPTPSDNPSSHEAFSTSFGLTPNTYTALPAFASVGLGVQIFAREIQTSTDIPEPATTFLLGLGCAFFLKRKRNCN